MMDSAVTGSMKARPWRPLVSRWAPIWVPPRPLPTPLPPPRSIQPSLMMSLRRLRRILKRRANRRKIESELLPPRIERSCLITPQSRSPSSTAPPLLQKVSSALPSCPKIRQSSSPSDSMAYEGHGLPMSFLDVAENYDIFLDHACGGVCACTTAISGSKRARRASLRLKIRNSTAWRPLPTSS